MSDNTIPPNPDGETLLGEATANSPCYASVPRLASRLITSGKNELAIDVGGTPYVVALKSVVQCDRASLLPQHQQLKNAPNYGGQNRTLLVVLEHKGGAYYKDHAVFDAATGELLGPSTEAAEFAEAIGNVSDEGDDGKLLPEGDILAHAERESFIEHSVPDFFRELSRIGTRAADGGYIIDESDRLFPLPKDFKPFFINGVPSDPRFAVEVKKTSDILRGLAQIWHHRRNGDTNEAFEMLRQISPKLEQKVRVEYQRLSTQSVAVRTLR